jgi:hypothetical protein
MTDQTLLTALQYAVIEPPDGGAAWPSGLWSRDEVLSYLNQRQDRLLRESLIHVKTSANLPILTGARVVTLPTDWMRTVTVVWLGDNGMIRELQRADTFQVDHADAALSRTSTGVPLYYMEYDSANLTVEIGPAPLVDGNLSVLYVPVGTELTGNGVSLLVPDELETAVKYGSLADMLGKDGRGKDATRAAYCEERYHMAVEAARLILEGWS